MAFQYGLQEKKYQEIGARSRQQYEELRQAKALKDTRESERAAETTVKLKAGETVFNLLEKGFTRKHKSIMKQDYFKESTFIPSGETEGINLFTSKKAADFPGAEMFVGETVQVNPSAYEALGRELAEINPGHAFKIPGKDVDKAGNVLKGPSGKLISSEGGKDFLPRWKENMDPSVWHTKIGEKYANELSGVKLSPQLTDTYTAGSIFDTSKLPPSNQAGGLNMNISEDVINIAGELTGAEIQLAKELGTWGKVGKALGPAGVLLGLGSGLHQAFTADDEGDRFTGAATATGSAMVGAGMAASAGLIGGVSTGGAVAGAAGGATLAGVGVSNFWNPVGWGIGIGAGLYGIGKGTGLW